MKHMIPALSEIDHKVPISCVDAVWKFMSKSKAASACGTFLTILKIKKK